MFPSVLVFTKHQTQRLFVCLQVQHLQTDPDLGPGLLLLQVSEENTVFPPNQALLKMLEIER